MKCQSHLQGSQQEHHEDGNIMFSPIKRVNKILCSPGGGIKKHSRSRWEWYLVFCKTELEKIASTLDLFQMLPSDCTSTSLYQKWVPKEGLYTKKISNCSPLKRFLKSLRDAYLLSSFFLHFCSTDIKGCV